MNTKQMKYVIIRDDDITPYSRRDMIEPLYEEFFRRGLSVSFSVIPDVNPNQRNDPDGPYNPFRDKFGIEYPAMIPPGYRGTGRRKEWDDNKELLDWFASMADSAEILQHGYDHAPIGKRNEFGIYDRNIVADKLDHGQAVLRKYFERAPEFFVAPCDAVTLASLKEIKRRFKGISLWQFDKLMSVAVDIKRCFSLRALREDISAVASMRRTEAGCFCWQDFMICTHPGYIFSRLEKPEKIEQEFHKAWNNSRIIVLVNHHWEYFFDWNGLDNNYFMLWKRLTKALLAREDCRIINFNRLHDMLLAKQLSKTYGDNS